MRDIEALRKLWETASVDQREEYLFEALISLHENVKSGFREMKKTCLCRQAECEQNFVKRKQAKIFGILIIVFAIGLGIGAGYLTWVEFLKPFIFKVAT